VGTDRDRGETGLVVLFSPEIQRGEGDRKAVEGITAGSTCAACVPVRVLLVVDRDVRELMVAMFTGDVCWDGIMSLSLFTT
jgi:hypothetical protein